MDNEPEEVIKHQMLETRASLAEKLETLEQQVVGTVQSATNAVTDTVESVKEAVQETVEMAKSSVHETVEAVKETFDLPRQVRSHPWVMFGGSVALGYVSGCLLGRARSGAELGYVETGPSLSTLATRPSSQRDGGLANREAAASTEAAPSFTAQHGRLGGLGETFNTELTKLKGLALGTMLGVVRDMVTQSAPPQLGPDLGEIIDSLTVKLGGKPVEGPVLDLFQHGGFTRQESPFRDTTEQRGSIGSARCSAGGAAEIVD
jgi:ElaB/YqjD/DUF883 family membrane-anchored ribosome-binding protein